MPTTEPAGEEYPIGTTMWIEQFVRTTAPSGRIHDGPIKRIRPAAHVNLTEVMRAFAETVARPANPEHARTVFQREVTVTAGAWAETGIKPPTTRSRMSDPESQG